MDVQDLFCLQQNILVQIVQRNLKRRRATTISVVTLNLNHVMDYLFLNDLFHENYAGPTGTWDITIGVDIVEIMKII